MTRLRTLLAVLGIAVLAGCSSTPPSTAKPAPQVSKWMAYMVPYVQSLPNSAR